VEKFFRVDELKDILRGIAKALCSYLSTQQRAIVKSSKIIYKFLWKNIRKLLSRRNCGDRILDATLYNLGEAEKFWPIFMQVKNN
jgi:hypothetical protein